MKAELSEQIREVETAITDFREAIEQEYLEEEEMLALEEDFGAADLMQEKLHAKDEHQNYCTPKAPSSGENGATEIHRKPKTVCESTSSTSENHMPRSLTKGNESYLAREC